MDAPDDILTADSERLLESVLAALTRRGIVTEEEIAARIHATDTASPAQGARMVARAWMDPAYRVRLLSDGTRAAEEMGIAMRGLPPLGVLENTASLHHLVVCTLCSCYPRAVLGYPPYWYKSAGYRARAVRDPRATMAEWGTTLPEGTHIRVVDSTADYRWMVLPLRPDDTEDWDEADLAKIVRETDMVGVTVPRA